MTANPTIQHNPILQFGTSRFLQAHADLFVSEAAQAKQALGNITIVQTTNSAQGAARSMQPSACWWWVQARSAWP